MTPRLSLPILALTAFAGLAPWQAKAAEGAPLLPRQVGVPIKPDAKSLEVIAQRQATLAALTPVTEAILKEPPPGEWLQWLRTYDEHGYSTLNQITKLNVGTMRPTWTWSLPVGTSEATPLVHDGVMFIYGAGDRVQALDATNGELLWEYTTPPQPGATPGAGGGGVMRNMAMFGDKLYVAMVNGHVVTLEMKTGKVVWDHLVADRKLRYGLSSGPLIVKGKVIQGVTSCGGTQPGGCFVVALDANTGNEVWRFNTIARPDEPGGNTWNGLPVEKRNGASVWTTPAYDPELNLIYVGTGNTYNWQDLVKDGPTKNKPGTTKEGLYLDSTLAINPDTGKLVWHYQHLPTDVWDLDFSFERQLIDLNVDGKPRKLVVTVGKTVILDALDRATGKWVFSKDMGIQNIVSSIDPKTGKKHYDPLTIPDLTGKRNNLQCPAGYGAKNWPSSAYNPNTKIVYMPLAEVCGESSPKLYQPDEVYSGGGQETRMARYHPKSDGNIGRLDALNLETRQIVWSARQRAAVTSAALATAGGLVFAGDSDRWFKAYDEATGKVLWQMRLNDAINSYPITYSVKGRQYVAVAAGFGGPRIANLHQLTPEIQTPRNPSAGLWVFALPEERPTN